MRFTLNTAPAADILPPGASLYITGSSAALGLGKKDTAQAAGPMIFSDDENRYILTVPLPAGKKVSFRLIAIDREGKVLLIEGLDHIYQVPAEGVWHTEFDWLK